ncbi:methyltransferase domain-containing protein [Nostoc sp. FACHB-152]|uniref:class I SAM-dependent methyltransferase n=1 Tax=unclassified Nostoc TaxID=2593658 RepID=UPI001685738C|nr:MULTISPECIES: class I SAM-dependent methyltransferase [unclassified Nostoc]MBD2451941.1 methyltransferase domain-containing protein [Nostoc sp. FACHB-152]MBD2472566.1 methyltransferase domain-containing protein [Nostoc sp. FACHB-145]
MLLTKIIDAYDHGAVDYEQIMLRYWDIDRKPLIASLQLKPGQIVLDAAVGTGLNLPAYPEGVSVVGVDLSQKMLDEARKKLIAADITFKVMDLQNLAFSDNSFDAAASGFTLCVVADPVRALEEILRVTRPGALIAILDYCKSRDPEIYKWQELITDAALDLGFPTGKIKWNALMDYDELIYHSNLPIEVLTDDRTESPNPFLCGCQLLLKNVKG